MGSPCLFLPCMPSILSAFCWVAPEMFETLSTGKIVITVQQLWILLKPRAYSSFWAIIFQNGDFKLSDVANNVRKLDRYLSFSYSSLAPNKEFYVTYTQKYNFYYQTCPMLQIINVWKLDRYFSFSYSSLAPNKEFYVTYTPKIQLLLSNFVSSWNMFFLYLLRTNNTHKNGASPCSFGRKSPITYFQEVSPSENCSVFNMYALVRALLAQEIMHRKDAQCNSG